MHEKVLKRYSELINEAKDLIAKTEKNAPKYKPDFQKWVASALNLLERTFGRNSSMTELFITRLNEPDIILYRRVTYLRAILISARTEIEKELGFNSKKGPVKNLITGNNKNSQLDFWSLIHKDVFKVSKDKFEDGHYADSVESAFKELNICVKRIVKEKTGKELDGSKLMNYAFSPNKPVIVLDDPSSKTGKDIQQGYMQIFAGAMIGIRNPKAHENITIT
jgi:uncharacterized protein (TIGR02391 family)